MKLEDYLAIPYRLVAYSAEAPDGSWRRFAAYPEIGVVSEADTPWEAQELLEEQRIRYITELEEKMREAARKFEFEKAAQLRDRVKALKEPGL